MKKNFGFDTYQNKLRVIADVPWMGFQHGEGELGVNNQGRFSRISSFTQETEVTVQHTPRIGEARPKLRSKERVLSAGCAGFSGSTPQFFFLSFVNDGKELTA